MLGVLTHTVRDFLRITKTADDFLDIRKYVERRHLFCFLPVGLSRACREVVVTYPAVRGRIDGMAFSCLHSDGSEESIGEQ